MKVLIISEKKVNNSKISQSEILYSRFVKEGYDVEEIELQADVDVYQNNNRRPNAELIDGRIGYVVKQTKKRVKIRFENGETEKHPFKNVMRRN